jgi:hypothetical protein
MNQFNFKSISGYLAISFYLIHGGYWVIKGAPANLFWACHIGSFIVGVGHIFNRSILNSIGVLWLFMGNLFWALYLLGGGDFEMTSVLTHIGGLCIGIYGIQKIGFYKNAWLYAVIFIALLQLICRFITPEIENVNLAFRVHEGWEKIFPSYYIYEIYLLAQASILFYSIEYTIFKFKKK